MIEQYLPLVAAVVVGLAGGELLNRVVPYLPDQLIRPFARAFEMYLNVWRRLIPDRVYKLWLRTGLMSEDAYRQFQERGFISDDLDPMYIQRTETHD